MLDEEPTADYEWSPGAPEPHWKAGAAALAVVVIACVGGLLFAYFAPGLLT